VFVGVLCVFVCVFVCSLRHPKSNSNTPYSYLWPLRSFHIFPHYLINCTIFAGKTLLGIKYLFGLLYSVCLKHFSFYEKMSEI